MARSKKKMMSRNTPPPTSSVRKTPRTILFHGGGPSSPLPVCLNCESTKQGRPCECVDSFKQEPSQPGSQRLKQKLIEESKLLDKIW